MQTDQRFLTSPAQSSIRRKAFLLPAAVLACGAVWTCPAATAQSALFTALPAAPLLSTALPLPGANAAAEVPEREASSSSVTTSLDLPQAPEPQKRSDNQKRPQLGDPRPAPGSTPEHQIAPKYTKFIPAGWTAQPLTAHEKVVMGAQDLYSYTNLAAIFLSAGYSHLTNGEPNYGSDKGAFGERLGAAAIRETSQGVFTDMVFGPLLHEDTRYHAEGPTYKPFHRLVYSITRPLVTRKDDGGATVNGALLLGYAASAALTPAFYPQGNRNFHDTASTFGTSIGGAALGFFVDEFTNDFLYTLHLRRTP